MSPAFFSAPIWKWPRRLAYSLAALIALLVIARLVAPPLVLHYINGRLAQISPLYQMQARDLDIHLWRMAYSFQGVTGTLKKDGSTFLTVDNVDVSLAWRNLVRKQFVVDVDVTRASGKLTTETIHAIAGYGQAKIKADAKETKRLAVPFDLERLRILASTFEFSDLPNLPPEQEFILTDITAEATHLTPQSPWGEEAIAHYHLGGKLQGGAPIGGRGELRPLADPLEWSLRLETHDFGLRSINPIARRTVPLTFEKGTLTLFAAVESVDGKLRGYLKPFFRDVVLIGNKGDFKGLKHFLIEVLGTIGNFFLKNRDSHALATKISFRTQGDHLDVDTGRAIEASIKNAFGSGLKQDFDEKLELQPQNPP